MLMRIINTHKTSADTQDTHTGGAEVNKDVLKDDGVHVNEKYSKKKKMATHLFKENSHSKKHEQIQMHWPPGARTHTHTHSYTYRGTLCFNSL